MTPIDAAGKDMIIGVGIDEIEVARVAHKLAAEAGLKEKLFTSGEIEYCESHRYGDRNFAARFAAKEALFKALGTGQRNGLAFSDIEITHDELGKPVCVVRGKTKQYIEEQGITRIHVSLTHLKEIAAAIVLLEKL